MYDLLTSYGHQDTFDYFSPSMQPGFPPEMAGDGTVVYEEFDELNDPDPNPGVSTRLSGLGQVHKNNRIVIVFH